MSNFKPQQKTADMQRNKKVCSYTGEKKINKQQKLPEDVDTGGPTQRLKVRYLKCVPRTEGYNVQRTNKYENDVLSNREYQ